MAILGIGVDVVHLPRITSLISRRGSVQFAVRILSSQEFRTFERGVPDIAKFLAVRFSVKEAAYKAMYPTVRPLWKDLSYRSFDELRPLSKPTLIIESDASFDSALVGKIHVSVSHDGDYVASTVLVEKRRGTSLEESNV